MAVTASAKYLGNIITSGRGVQAIIEDRRNQGWGRVAQILEILQACPRWTCMGSHRVEVGLMLRKAMLTSNLLYSAEAWSAVSESDIKRLEQVDSALIKGLVKGHSKTSVFFHYLETGTLMLRHIIRINRLIYHRHIINIGEEETVRKIYEKQKQGSFKGDWINLIKSDFEFMGIDINEKDIRKTSKDTYRKKIKYLVRKAALKNSWKKRTKYPK